MLSRIAVLLIVAIGSMPLLPAAHAADPAVDFNSILTDVTFYEKHHADQSRGGQMAFNAELISAFLPDSSLYTGQGDYQHEMFSVLRKGGAELARFKFWVNAKPMVFQSLQNATGPEGFTFEEAGDYTLTFEFQGRPITTLAFSISFEQSNDAFNPQRYTFVEGPWSQLGILVILDDKPDSAVEFRTWTRGGTFGEDLIGLDVLHEGDVVYVSRPHHAGNISNYRKAEFTFNFPDAAGSGAIKAKQLLATDGQYHIVMRRAGKVDRVYPFTVQGGKIQPHPRSALGYQPNTDYLMSRTVQGVSHGNFEQLHWLQRLSDADAAAFMGQGATQVAGPSAAERARWQVKSSGDPGRPFQLVVTDIAARMDGHIAAGDGIVAFGTGSRTGISFLRAGEDQEQSIPGSQDYMASTFAVCGKKIVAATKDSTVHVFDTTTGQTSEIPAGEISLNRNSGGLYQPNWLHAGGNLVATINDSKKTADRVILKVIDVSGPTPVVIPIKNEDYVVGETTSVAVDPVLGKVAIGLKRKSAIYVADVVPRAVQKVHDLSGHDGFGDCQVLMGGGYVAYNDASGSRKFRMLKLDGGQIFTAGPQAKGMYTIHGARYAYPNLEPASAATQYMFGTAPSQPAKAGGSGEGLGKTNGKCGIGQSVAISEDGTVFLAGDTGIGSGEYLQATDGTQWVAVKGPDGNAIPASDVVMGNGMLAFKTGKANKTTVGYATFGARIDIASLAVAAAGDAAPAAAGRQAQAAAPSDPGPTEQPMSAAAVAEHVEAAKRQAEAEVARQRAEMGLVDDRAPATPAPADTASAAVTPDTDAVLVDEHGGMGLRGMLHWVGRLGIGAVLAAAGAVLAGALVVAKVPAAAGVVNALRPHANTIGLAAIGLAVFDFVMDLTILRPVISDGVPQALALVGGVILAKSAVLGAAPSAEGGGTAKAAAGAVKGAQEMLTRHADTVAKLEAKAIPVGLACLIAGIVHLVAGNIDLI